MNYSEILRKLWKINNFVPAKVNLENMRRIQLHLPPIKWKSVHVAGTNGKGSVAIKTQSVLSLSGYKTGLYTSPHISTFRERIRIDGEMITADEVTDIMNFIFSVAEKENIPLTFFENITAMAFMYYSLKQADWAVIECGMGGLLDATNVINPNVCVVTTIGLDHQEFLGETIDLIALNKAGIIKKNVPIVIGPKAEPKEVFFKVAISKDAEVVDVKGSFLDFEEENNSIARTVISKIGETTKISEKAVRLGLKYRMKCRIEDQSHLASKWDKIDRILLDGAHNSQGVRALVDHLRLLGGKWQVFVNFSRVKEASKFIRMLDNFHIRRSL